jgi:hypothetical protein
MSSSNDGLSDAHLGILVGCLGLASILIAVAIIYLLRARGLCCFADGASGGGSRQRRGLKSTAMHSNDNYLEQGLNRSPSGGGGYHQDPAAVYTAGGGAPGAHGAAYDLDYGGDTRHLLSPTANAQGSLTTPGGAGGVLSVQDRENRLVTASARRREQERTAATQQQQQQQALLSRGSLGLSFTPTGSGTPREASYSATLQPLALHCLRSEVPPEWHNPAPDMGDLTIGQAHHINEWRESLLPFLKNLHLMEPAVADDPWYTVGLSQLPTGQTVATTDARSETQSVASSEPYIASIPRHSPAVSNISERGDGDEVPTFSMSGSPTPRLFKVSSAGHRDSGASFPPPVGRRLALEGGMPMIHTSSSGPGGSLLERSAVPQDSTESEKPSSPL